MSQLSQIDMDAIVDSLIKGGLTAEELNKAFQTSGSANTAETGIKRRFTAAERESLVGTIKGYLGEASNTDLEYFNSDNCGWNADIVQLFAKFADSLKQQEFVSELKAFSEQHQDWVSAVSLLDAANPRARQGAPWTTNDVRFAMLAGQKNDYPDELPSERAVAHGSNLAEADGKEEMEMAKSSSEVPRKSQRVEDWLCQSAACRSPGNITTALFMLNADHCKWSVLEPAIIHDDSISPIDLEGPRSGETIVLPLYNKDDRWMIAFADTSKMQLLIYSSFPDIESCRKWGDIVREAMQEACPGCWRVTPVLNTEPILISNIRVLVFAIHYMQNREMPVEYSIFAWQRFFDLLIGHQCEGTPEVGRIFNILQAPSVTDQMRTIEQWLLSVNDAILGIRHFHSLLPQANTTGHPESFRSKVVHAISRASNMTQTLREMVNQAKEYLEDGPSEESRDAALKRVFDELKDELDELENAKRSFRHNLDEMCVQEDALQAQNRSRYRAEESRRWREDARRQEEDARRGQEVIQMKVEKMQAASTQKRIAFLTELLERLQC